MSNEEIRAEVDALNIEYKAFTDELKRDWLSKNRIRSGNVLEVMSDTELAEVDRRIREWHTYITPLADEWWRERGYETIWLDDSKKPMLLRKLGHS